MKSILITVLFVALFVLSPAALANEERAKDIEQQIEQRVAEIVERLELTDAQRADLEPILRAGFEEQKKILESYGFDADGEGGRPSGFGRRDMRAMRGELKAVRSQTMNDVEKILTPEQMAELEVIQDERRAEMRERIGAAR